MCATDDSCFVSSNVCVAPPQSFYGNLSRAFFGPPALSRHHPRRIRNWASTPKILQGGLINLTPEIPAQHLCGCDQTSIEGQLWRLTPGLVWLENRDTWLPFNSNRNLSFWLGFCIILQIWPRLISRLQFETIREIIIDQQKVDNYETGIYKKPLCMFHLNMARMFYHWMCDDSLEIVCTVLAKCDCECSAGCLWLPWHRHFTCTL